MRLQKMTKFLFLLVLVTSAANAQDKKDDEFRTPAKRYGSAYTMKLTLKRGLTEYVTTMWVKPDQAESTLDYNQMKELGWSEPLDPKKPFMNFDDASIVGTPIEKTSFKNQKAEWAYVPDFPRSCCYGVIGRDILSQYRVKFVPKNPTHLEWTKVAFDPATKIPATFTQFLANLFSFRSEQGTYQKKRLDLSEVGYTLDLSERKLEFAPAPQSKEEKALHPRARSIFEFYFVPPIRKVKIESIDSAVAKSAKKVGIQPGMLITTLNGEHVFLLDQFEVQAYLKGKRTDRLTIIADKLSHPVVFDFAKGEFQGQQ
jgi:hypothetical protein